MMRFSNCNFKLIVLIVSLWKYTNFNASALDLNSFFVKTYSQVTMGDFKRIADLAVAVAKYSFEVINWNVKSFMRIYSWITRPIGKMFFHSSHFVKKYDEETCVFPTQFSYDAAKPCTMFVQDISLSITRLRPLPTRCCGFCQLGIC